MTIQVTLGDSYGITAALTMWRISPPQDAIMKHVTSSVSSPVMVMWCSRCGRVDFPSVDCAHFLGFTSMEQPGYFNATSTINWCEEDYNVTPYIAEFINTITNSWALINIILIRDIYR